MYVTIRRMSGKYVNFTQISKPRSILTQLNASERIFVKMYFPPVARQQKSSQMNANSIRCVTIAGVCKRQNGSPPPSEVFRQANFSLGRILEESFRVPTENTSVGIVTEFIKSRQCDLMLAS